jgi:hypothetical protein
MSFLFALLFAWLSLFFRKSQGLKYKTEGWIEKNISVFLKHFGGFFWVDKWVFGGSKNVNYVFLNKNELKKKKNFFFLNQTWNSSHYGVWSRHVGLG